MSSITIRPATSADAPLIADLSRLTFYETFAQDNTKEDMDKFMNEQFSREKLITQVTAKGNLFLMAFLEQEFVGYVRLVDSTNPKELGSEPAIEIARIYSAASAIGKGVGKALMQKCIDIALEQKKKIIWLGVWEKNGRAINFYQKWGFEKFGEQPFVLGNDVQIDWLMKKVL